MSDRLPKEAGEYFWDEWGRTVKVVKRGANLYTRVYPHWQEIKVTPRIAGRFYPVVDGKPRMGDKDGKSNKS